VSEETNVDQEVVVSREIAHDAILQALLVDIGLARFAGRGECSGLAVSQLQMQMVAVPRD